MPDSHGDPRHRADDVLRGAERADEIHAVAGNDLPAPADWARELRPGQVVDVLTADQDEDENADADAEADA